MTESLLKLCAHRAADGAQCMAPALRQSNYCRHHARVHRPTAILPAYAFAETPENIRLALLHAMDDIASGQVTDKLGGQILHELNKRICALAAVNPDRSPAVRAQSSAPAEAEA